MGDNNENEEEQEHIDLVKFSVDDVDRQIIRLSLRPDDESAKVVSMLINYRYYVLNHDQWVVDIYNKGRDDQKNEILNKYDLVLKGG